MTSLSRISVEINFTYIQHISKSSNSSRLQFEFSCCDFRFRR